MKKIERVYKNSFADSKNSRTFFTTRRWILYVNLSRSYKLRLSFN